MARPMTAAQAIGFDVRTADALQFEADVLVLKYAQASHGLDRVVYEFLTMGGNRPELPGPGDFALYQTNGRLAPTSVLFVGVKPLNRFGYAEIRDFARNALGYLAERAATTQHVALTIHGPGYGLDEIEAFQAEFAGLVDGITSGAYPQGLETITLVDKDENRAKRLDASLRQLLPEKSLQTKVPLSRSGLQTQTQHTLRTAGYGSAAKPHVFVAMPFAEEMNDIFHYGIQKPVNDADLLCERADLSAFTGDVMEWVKGRIATAKLVVADLSTANPNVYLEVGYAWASRVPTVLLVNDPSALKFDVSGQHVVVYKSIRNLEEALRSELKQLQSSGALPEN